MTTSKFIYLIAFHSVTEKFISNDEGLVGIIRTNNRHGINYIKVFDPVKERFYRVSKATLKSHFDYHTDLIQLLNSANFIKL